MEPSIVPILRSARYDACVASYQLMTEQSVVDPDPVGTEVIDENPEFRIDYHRMIWTGLFGELMNQLGFSISKGTAVVNDLTRMGCIEVLQLGKHGIMSQVVLVKPPTQDLFINYKDATYSASRKAAEQRAKFEEEATLLDRIQRLEDSLEVLIQELQSHLEVHDEIET